MKIVSYSVSHFLATTPSILDSLLDAKEMGAKTVLFTSVPNKDSQAYTETVLVATTASLPTSNVYPLNSLCSSLSI